VREFSVPATAAVADDENLTDMVQANAERFATAIGLRRRVDGTWVDVTTRQFADEVSAVAKGLLAAGLRPGDRVGLMSKTRYEWSLLDFAIWSRRPGLGADLRDVLAGAGGVDPVRLGGEGRDRGDHGAPGRAGRRGREAAGAGQRLADRQ